MKVTRCPYYSVPFSRLTDELWDSHKQEKAQSCTLGL